MIKRINSIKNFGIIREFNGTDINEFKKFNLIYGFNASGKTTLSRIFRSLELGEVYEGFNEDKLKPYFEITTDENQSIKSSNFSKIPYIRVFNQDFIRDNVFTKNGARLIYFGKENKKNIENITKLKLEKKETERVCEPKIQYLMDKKTDLKNFYTNKARNIKRSLSIDLGDEHASYNATKFKENITRFEKQNHFNLNPEEEAAELKKIKQRPLKEIPGIEMHPYPHEFPDLKNILEKNLPFSSDDLKDKSLNLMNWIKKGLELHHNKDACEFCEGLLSPDRIEKLKDLFNEEVKNFSNQMKEYKNEWREFLYKIETQRSPGEEEFYDKYKEEFKKIDSEYKSKYSGFKIFIEKNIINNLDKKEKDPSIQISFEFKTFPFDVCSNISQMMRLVNENNNHAVKLAEEIKSSKKNLENHFLYECADNFQKLNSEIENLNRELESKKKEIQSIDDQIQSCTSLSDELPLTRINSMLNTVFYKEDGKLQLKKTKNTENDTENYYETHMTFASSQIKLEDRNISEGEKTIIALVYFLSKLEENDFRTEQEKIVFIDDPISSLDSNILISAFGLIKESCDNLNQLFISTHNHTFFQYIKSWFKTKDKRKTKDKKRTRVCEYFMMERKKFENKPHAISAILNPLDKLLRKYDSEYQYNFKVLYKHLNLSNNDSLKLLYPLPNIARKFLEIFSAFECPSESGFTERLSKLKENHSNKDINIEAIKKFINEGSHSNIGKTANLNLDNLSEITKNINQVFNLVKAVNENHFNELEKSINTQTLKLM